MHVNHAFDKLSSVNPSASYVSNSIPTFETSSTDSFEWSGDVIELSDDESDKKVKSSDAMISASKKKNKINDEKWILNANPIVETSMTDNLKDKRDIIELSDDKGDKKSNHQMHWLLIFMTKNNLQ